MKNNLNVIVLLRFGSSLYGTNTPESDQDFKGIFLPSKEQIFLNKIPKSISENTKVGTSKNTKNDVDTEMYSLHYFLKLACEGQTCALDMIHAPDNMILKTSNIWKKIVNKKELFYTKNMQAFLGYALRQASKYGIKGSRLAAAKKVLDYLNEEISKYTYELELSTSKINLREFDKYLTIKKIWGKLPRGEHIYDNEIDPNGNRVYQVCGKKVQETANAFYFKKMMEKFYDSYGERAKQAEHNENIDWKSVSHAMRAAIQLKELYTKGTITFPLKEAMLIKYVKEGLYSYKWVAGLLEKYIEEVKELAEKSNYPEKVDKKYWDKFLIKEVERRIK